jgi:hypothetical protein
VRVEFDELADPTARRELAIGGRPIVVSLRRS